MKTEYELVVFDWDGTLMDSEARIVDWKLEKIGKRFWTIGIRKNFHRARIHRKTLEFINLSTSVPPETRYLGLK